VAVRVRLLPDAWRGPASAGLRRQIVLWMGLTAVLVWGIAGLGTPPPIA